ncbi:CDPK-related kinase 2 [Prunus persica]|uniref:CDPK-related kinase 2 n=1 Tax=Prunus persica TaxID=3760 RepID=UPI0009AB4C3B|nr:CDPK-related kinase 2 [Prunus persica]
MHNHLDCDYCQIKYFSAIVACSNESEAIGSDTFGSYTEQEDELLLQELGKKTKLRDENPINLFGLPSFDVIAVRGCSWFPAISIIKARSSGLLDILIVLSNSLYSAKDENSQLKAIDFGLLDFAKPDERLNDIVGSAYYVTLEVLHRTYSTEPDVWSIGVISYILLCGSRPFWARTESGTSRAVLKADPSFDEALWPSLSLEANYVVKRLLNKDPQK